MSSELFKSVSDIIMLNKPLGTGAFSEVTLVRHKSSLKSYALKKLLKKDETEVEYIKKEIELHLKLKHKNIIALEHTLETKEHMYLFLEYAENGDLFEYVRREHTSQD